MTFFIKKITTFSSIIILLLFLLGNWINPNWRSIKREKDYDIPNSTIDLLFLGTSLSQRFFIPSVYDSTMSLYAYNLSSCMQTPRSSYYLIREVLKKHAPQIIVFQEHYLPMIVTNEFENISFNFEYMKFQLLSNLKLHEQMELLFPVFRYKDYFYQINDEMPIKPCFIFDKGFLVQNDDTNVCQFKNEIISTAICDFNLDQEEFIKRAIDLCNEKKLNLL